MLVHGPQRELVNIEIARPLTQNGVLLRFVHFYANACSNFGGNLSLDLRYVDSFRGESIAPRNRAILRIHKLDIDQNLFLQALGRTLH